MKLYNVYLVLFFLSVTPMWFTCTSKTIPSVPPATDDVVAVSPPPTPRVKELELPEYPYISQSEIALYVSNSIIIETLSTMLGFASSPFLSLIEHVHASVNEKGIAVVLRVNAISFMQKKKLLASMSAVSLDASERYWRYEDEHGRISYFDIGYKNAVVMASVNPMSNEALAWGWSPPYEYIRTPHNKTLDAWFWSMRLESIQKYEVEGFKIHALGVVVLNYSSAVDPDIKTTFIFEYSGERSARTTLRLLIPRLLESIDTSTNFSSLPHVMFVDNVLLLEGLIVSNTVFWNHITAVMRKVEEQ